MQRDMKPLLIGRFVQSALRQSGEGQDSISQRVAHEVATYPEIVLLRTMPGYEASASGAQVGTILRGLRGALAVTGQHASCHLLSCGRFLGC